MAHDLLCLFKSSRRTEYTQENLRILSGAVGDEVEVGYTLRWLSDEVRQRPPQVGDPVLVVLSDPPYAKSLPVRRATVERVAFADDSMRLRLRLGPRVAVDANRWKPHVAATDNPASGTFAVRVSVDAEVIEDLVDAARELKGWKRQIDAISHADGYERIAFLRVGRVREVGAAVVEAPFRLISGRSYQVDVLAYNPHLADDTLAALRLVAFPDPSRADVALDAQPIPADGVVELMLVPQDQGPASLEFNVSRGAEFWFALEFDWLTLPAAVPEPVLARDDAPQRATTQKVDQVATHLLRGYMLLRGHHPVRPETRLRLLDELLEAAPGHERLMEQRGIVLHELRQWPEAAALLGGLTPAELSAEGRTDLVSSWFMLGQLPDPLERITIADFSRDEWFEMLLDASRRLTTDEQVAVARLLGSTVLAEDRASRWISPLATAVQLARRNRLDLIGIWQYADPAAAAAGFEQLVDAGNVDLVDPDFAGLALDLGLEAHRMRLARPAAFALLAHHADREDVAALEQLLDLVMARFAREDRHEIGEEIVLAIADVASDDDDIDHALDVAADLIEAQRQRGDLDAAARLAVFATANEHRASKPVVQHLEGVLARLGEAFEKSETIQQFREARRRELNLDLRDFVGGKKVLVVGANEQPWWTDVRMEFGFDVSSEWVSTEKRKAPSLDRLIRKLDNVDLLIVQTGRISHKTSEPLMRTAKERKLQTISVSRPTRDAFTMAIRVGLAGSGGAHHLRAGAMLGGVGPDELMEEGRR